MRTLCITHRAAAGRPLPEQVREICSVHPQGVILREKDLPLEDYRALALSCGEICRRSGTPFLLHGLDLPPEEYLESLLCACAGEESVRATLSVPAVVSGERRVADGIHLSMRDFLWVGDHVPAQVLSALHRQGFLIGVSTHSVEEAEVCERRGADYITASHIFPTDCKRGLPPRGLSWLQEVCRAVRIPVYALGGIDEGNAASCLAAGACGICVMSLCMRPDARKRLQKLVRTGSSIG